MFFLGNEQGKINDSWTLDRGANCKGKGHPGIQKVRNKAIQRGE